MELQQVYCYDRIAAEPERPAEPSSFAVGLCNAVALSLPLWALIVWLLKLVF